MCGGRDNGGVPELEWGEVREWFDPVGNGSAPDVVVEGTTLDDWRELLALVRESGWRAEYEVDGERFAVPGTAAELFVADGLRSLWVWPLPDLELIVRVWAPELILGDVSLHELQGQERLDASCGILRVLGRRLGKRVAMYAEGSYDKHPPMLAYEVATDRVIFLAGPWGG